MDTVNIHIEDVNWITGGQLPYGWAGSWRDEIPGVAFFNHLDKYNQIVVWIKENINNAESNALWTMFGDTIYVHFRKSKDMSFFMLRWG
jgi:hypothetical protein